MKLLTFREENELKLGVLTENGVLQVEKASKSLGESFGGLQVPLTMEDAIAGATSVQALQSLLEAAQGSAELFVAESDLQFGPCVPNPGKIICVGLNYRKHAAESNLPVPETPVLFPKYQNAITASGADVQLPAGSSEVDYEAELTIVIGQKAKHVSKQEALGKVFGYCNANDLSARDLQFRTSQWLLGKTCDGFSPVGPYLVTADEVGNPNQLGIRCYVNGEKRQDSNTSDMVFYCDYIVSYLSDYMTLEPGDIILTGTPEGVVHGMPKNDQTPWLKAGDEIVVEIDKLGRLVNRMVKEA